MVIGGKVVFQGVRQPQQPIMVQGSATIAD
jgi:hypothetical protein